MNKILYGASIFCLILLTGCSQEELFTPAPQLQGGGEVTISFSAVIPEFKTVLTRANGGVNDMYLLVFDENGNFIVRKQATLSNQTEQGGTFTALLPSTNKPRIIHFISNFEEESYNDTPGVNEAGVVALLHTQNVAFWSRMELNDGISATSFNGKTVTLLRNQAKISVVNNAANFSYDGAAGEGFAIHNKPEKGTVAPYSVANGFAEHTIAEPSGVTLVAAQSSDISTSEKQLFERKNASASSITTVIVKGRYNGQSYYYKIDLIDANTNRYDIERNYHYVVRIENVTRVGYTSFDDALAGASHNNTALDPIIEKYPMISDGTSKLEVEKTLLFLTQPGEIFQVWAKYFPDINNSAFDNAGVTVALQVGNEALNATSLNFDPETGIITAAAVAVLPAEPKEAVIRVSKGELARSVRVILRLPFSFDPVTINNANPATLNGAQGQDATLRFQIPNDFPDDLFPLPVRIYTQGLYAAATGLEMVVEKGQIHYIYRATQKGTQTVQFKTNKSANAEAVILQADYFGDGTVGYNVVNRTGNLTYGAASIPVPYSFRNNLSVTAGTINLLINESGKYIWALTNAQASQSQTVRLEVVEGLLRKQYSRTIIPNNTIDIHLNTETILAVEGGTITYGGVNMSVSAGTPMTAGATVTVSSGSIEITADGKYKYTPPASTNINSTASVTFTYIKQVNSNYSEEYRYTTTMANLFSNPTIVLSPVNFIFTGTIQYNIFILGWNNVPNNATVSLDPNIGTISVSPAGQYKYTVPVSAYSTPIRFRYRPTVTNYDANRTPESLKTNSALRLD